MGRFCLDCTKREGCTGCAALNNYLARTCRSHHSVSMRIRNSQREQEYRDAPRILCVGGTSELVRLEEMGLSVG